VDLLRDGLGHLGRHVDSMDLLGVLPGEAKDLIGAIRF